ncbi:MAG TPA: hypothetical protein DIW46_08235 [Microbacterium sp.]|nr:hypothetical protein [Microbacterium sp.]
MRSATVFRGVLAALVSRGIYVLAPLVTIPLALQQLGVNGYGAWSAALALTAFTSFADLGLGVGLMTRLAGALADSDRDRARVLVASTYGMAAAIVALLIAALWSTAPWIDWAQIIGGSGPGDQAIVLITLTVFLLNVVAGLIVRIQYAAQQVALSNAWQSAASLMGIGGVLAAVALDVSSPIFVLMAGASQTFVTLVNAWWFFTFGAGREFRPSIRSFRGSESKALIRLGGRFLIISVLISLSMATDPLIIGNAVGLEAVAEYAVPAKIFAMLTTVVSAISIPLWTANVEALRVGDAAWVRRITQRMTVLSGGSVLVLAAVAVLLAPWVIATWLGGQIDPSVILLCGLGTVATVQAIAAPLFMVQNAAEVLLPQTIGYALLLLMVPIKWFVVVGFGSEWIPWITVAGYCLFVWPTAVVGYRRAVRHGGTEV